MSGVFNPKDCNPSPSSFPSLDDFCIPDCEIISNVSPIQENPVVVTPIIDPPNIDAGCFPLKTETQLTVGGRTPVLDFINDYSKISLSKDGEGNPVYDYDFCQPILKLRLNVPRGAVAGSEVYTARALENLCGTSGGMVRLYRQEGTTLATYKDVEACVASGSAPAGMWGSAWKDPADENEWTFAPTATGAMQGISLSDMDPGDSGMAKFTDGINWNNDLTVQVKNVGRIPILTDDPIIGAFVHAGICQWRVKRAATCVVECTLDEDIAEDASGSVTVSGFSVANVQNEGPAATEGQTVSVRYEPITDFPGTPDANDKVYFPCSLGGGGSVILARINEDPGIDPGDSGEVQPCDATGTPEGDPIPDVINNSGTYGLYEQFVKVFQDSQGNFFF